MDFAALWSAVLAGLTAPGPMHWLILAGLAGAGTILAMMVAMSERHRRLKGAVIGRDGHNDTVRREIDTSLGLSGSNLSPIDRVFPRHPIRFLVLVTAISVGAWITGYLMAPDKKRFFASAEWWFQPMYIAAHLIALRLFINVFTRNFAAGVNRLQVSLHQAIRGIRPILGARGAALAALVAMPFSYFDFQYLFGHRYQRMGEQDQVLAVDYLMWGIWTLEWFINAFIWVLLIGFMLKNWTVIRGYPFRAPIHEVLEDKHYRPFLHMSSQSSTVVLAFSFATVLYLVFTGGELTDYLGLGITVLLLVAGFVPPWLLLKRKVDEAVERECAALRSQAGLSAGQAAMSFAQAVGPDGPTEGKLAMRVDQALALLRLWHLNNLYGNLGHTEARAIIIRLLAPAATIGWQAMQTQGEVMKRIMALAGPWLGR